MTGDHNVTIEPYAKADVPHLVSLFNRQCEHERHVAVLTAEMFAQFVEAKPYFDPRGLLVARRNGEVAGWVHAAVTGPTESWYDPAMKLARLSMLVYRPGELEVGQALIHAATQWLRDQGHERIYAFHAHGGYPFYRGLFTGGEYTGPSSLAHLHQALRHCGYATSHESVTQSADMPTAPKPVEPRVPAEFHDRPLTMAHETMAASWTGFEPRVIDVTIEGEHAGQIGYVVLRHLAARLGSPCLDIYMMGVNPQRRRLGLGSALVNRAMRAGYDRGARVASVYTEMHNQAAAATYARCGFAPFGLNLGRVLEVAAT
jgi:GNAT superfamily N-acetyltransferase